MQERWRKISSGVYMKKEAVTTRPMASIMTDRVGYHASGTGLVIAFGAFTPKNKIKNQKSKIEKRKTEKLKRRIQLQIKLDKCWKLRTMRGSGEVEKKIIRCCYSPSAFDLWDPERVKLTLVSNFRSFFVFCLWGYIGYWVYEVDLLPLDLHGNGHTEIQRSKINLF